MGKRKRAYRVTSVISVTSVTSITSVTSLLGAAALVAVLAGCADQRVAGSALDAVRSAERGPLTGGELRETVLGGEDLPAGIYGPEDAPNAAPLVARDPDCAGLARLLSAGIGSPSARAFTTVAWSAPDASARTTLAVASFAEGGAQEVVDEGVGALGRCLTFAASATDGAPGRAPQCVPAPEAGDMSLGLVLAAPDGSGGAEETATGYVVVRIGDILAVFGHQAADGSPALPDPLLVEQQVARISARLA